MSGDDLSRQVLESEVERLQARNAELEGLLTRPVAVTVSAPDSYAMQQVVTYLPQLTMIATNLSYAVSAIQTQNNNLDRIAKALEGGKP